MDFNQWENDQQSYCCRLAWVTTAHRPFIGLVGVAKALKAELALACSEHEVILLDCQLYPSALTIKVSLNHDIDPDCLVFLLKRQTQEALLQTFGDQLPTYDRRGLWASGHLLMSKEAGRSQLFKSYLRGTQTA